MDDKSLHEQWKLARLENARLRDANLKLAKELEDANTSANELAETIDAMGREIEELRADAARYRHLKYMQSHAEIPAMAIENYEGDDLDAWLDADMATHGNQE